MKRTISGVLRCVFASMVAIRSILNFIKMNSFKGFSAQRTGFQMGNILMLLLVINIIFYMAFNAVKDFRHEPIRLKPMYILFTLTFLIAVLCLYPLQNIHGGDLIFLIIHAILFLYFIVNDFINLWFRKSIKIN